MKSNKKIHYNPYASFIPVEDRLPKTICGAKNIGTNETHIKDDITCINCQRAYKNVRKYLTKVIKNCDLLLSLEEIESAEYYSGPNNDFKPHTKRELKIMEEEFNDFLRKTFGSGGDDGDVYLFDGLILTSEGKIEDTEND